MEVHFIINLLNLILSCLGLLISLIILLFIFTYIRPLKSNVPLILTCNTYIASAVSSAISVRAFFNFIFPSFHHSARYTSVTCNVLGYLTYVSLGIVFYSIILHACYRLVRIVFYQKRFLYSPKIFAFGIFLHWLIVILINLIFPILNEIDYIPSVYRCQVHFENLAGNFLVLTIEYSIPSTVISTIYLHILRYIHRTNTLRRNRHDMIILKQILFIFITFQFLSTPLCVLWILYTSSLHLDTSLGYQLQGLVVSINQCFFPIALIFLTPQLKWKRQQRRIRALIQVI